MWVFRQSLSWLWCLSSPFQIPACAVFSSSVLLPGKTKLRYSHSPHMPDFLGKATTSARTYPWHNLARFTVLTAVRLEQGAIQCTIPAWLLSVIFMANKGKFHLGSKFENSGCLKHFLSFSLSYANLCFHGNRNENLLAACRQAADDSFLYQISAADFQITAPRTHCNNKHRDFSTILALPVCITLL